MAAPLSRIGRRAALALALWLAALAAGAGARLARPLRRRSLGLPAGGADAEQAVLLDQLKNGATSRLLLIGIEGAPPAPTTRSAAAARAEASSRLAAALRASELFASVDNGDNAAWADSGRFVFEHRYLLSPAVDAARFSVAGLREAIDDTVALLGTPAGSLLKPILFRDPTGETVRIAEALTPARAPKSENGVWVSRDDAARAAAGDDARRRRRPRRPAARAGAVQSAFDAVAPPGLRLRRLGRRPLRRRFARAHQGRGRAPRRLRLGDRRRPAAARLRAPCARFSSRCCRSPPASSPASPR